MSEAGGLVVIGAINVDLVVSGAALPQPGETVTDGEFSRHHGGKGGNQAVAAARLKRTNRKVTVTLPGSTTPTTVGQIGLLDFAPAPATPLYFPDDAFWVHRGHAILVNEEENNTLIEIAYPSGAGRRR